MHVTLLRCPPLPLGHQVLLESVLTAIGVNKKKYKDIYKLDSPTGQSASVHASVNVDFPLQGCPLYHGPLHTRVRVRIPKNSAIRFKYNTSEQSLISIPFQKTSDTLIFVKIFAQKSANLGAVSAFQVFFTRTFPVQTFALLNLVVTLKP